RRQHDPHFVDQVPGERGLAGRARKLPRAEPCLQRCRTRTPRYGALDGIGTAEIPIVRALDASPAAVGVDVERCGRPIVEVRAVVDDLPGRRLVLVRSNALRTGPTITRQAPGQQTQRQRDRGARQERSHVDASAPECHSWPFFSTWSPGFYNLRR